jgi:hypothetical protein
MAVQLDLPLEKESKQRPTYYKAWVRSGMKLPYEPGSRERAISQWLRNLSDSLREQNGMKHCG